MHPVELYTRLHYVYVLYAIYDAVLSFWSATLVFVLPLRSRPLRGLSVVRTQEGSVLYVCIKFQADGSIRSKVIRCPKISKLVRTQDVCVLYVCSKFKADSSIR